MKVPYLNNTFILLTKLNAKPNNSLDDVVANLLGNMDYDLADINNFISYKKSKNFKIMILDQVQPRSVDFQILKPFEKEIISALGISLNLKNPDLEFVIQRRRTGLTMLMLKITYNRVKEQQLNRGELRPELSYILCRLAKLEKSDIVLDPFVGYGSIPKQIIKNFKYNMLFASDNDERLFNNLKQQYKGNARHFFIKNFDAVDLNVFKDPFINKIITDPPWNLYDAKAINMVDFYAKVLDEFNRILSPQGKIILLMGNADDFEEAINKKSIFNIEMKTNILVNGKKANIYI